MFVQTKHKVTLQAKIDEYLPILLDSLFSSGLKELYLQAKNSKGQTNPPLIQIFLWTTNLNYVRTT